MSHSLIEIGSKTAEK